ncbi:MAG: TVP38/TMEM64 family protein [Phormidesmis sp.]
MKVSRKFLFLFFLAMLCAIVASLAGRQNLSLLFNRSALTAFFESATGPRGVLCFLCAHIVANAVGVPGTLLVAVGGAVYGLLWGTLLSVVGATLGAIAAFWLARYLLYSWFKQRFARNPFVTKMNGMLCDRALSCVLTIRFSPISPFNVVNFAFGLTPVPTRAYALGTLIGIIPGTLAYTWLGVTGAEALNGGSMIPLVVCLLLLTLLSVLPILLQRQSVS